MIKSIPGYSEVADLLPDGHLLTYKQVWSLNFCHFLTHSGDLASQLSVELTTNRDAYDIDTVIITFENPSGVKLYPNWDIIQLTIDDCKIDGWEQKNYHVYDAEMDTDWELYCERITFKRGKQTPPVK